MRGVWPKNQIKYKTTIIQKNGKTLCLQFGKGNQRSHMAGQAGGGEGAASRELELELELCGELLPSASAVFIVVAPSY